MAKNKKHNSKFCKLISFLLVVCTVIVGSIIVYFDILPNKYLIPGGIILGILILIIVYKLNAKTNLSTKIICTLLSIIFIFIEVTGTVYAFGTIDFFNNIFDTGLITESYALVIKDDSTYTKIKDLNGKTIAIRNEEESNIDKALKKLSNRITYNTNKYDNIESMVSSLDKNESDVLFINESIISVYLEEHNIDNLRILDTIDITIKNTSDFKDINVSKKPFAIYISGIDTSGKVNKSARSDVNIVAVVNPKTAKILLLSTPRDYYVTLASKNAKDKLTHAGIYGVEESAKTLGNLYNIDINYYIRVNFTSFIKIIDTLDGITVDVEKPDYRYNNSIDCGLGYICEQNSKREFGNKIIYVKSGTNQKLNGEQALAYARNRYQYSSGDIARGKHQTEIINAMIDKALSANTLSKYNSLLKVTSSGLITNMNQKTITKLINYQLDENPKWSISSYSVTGTDGYEKTYSLGSSKAYVLIPNEESVIDAKNKINELLLN